MTQLELKNLFKSVFPTADFDVQFEALELNSFPEWDSLGNLNLLLRIEENLDFRFTSDEFSEVKSVKQVINILKNKGLYED
jgi:acyl carrier protein